MRFISSVFAFPIHILGGPRPDSSADMEKLQFAFSPELMVGGCPRCVRMCGNTQKVGHGSKASFLTPLREPGATLPFLTA